MSPGLETLWTLFPSVRGTETAAKLNGGVRFSWVCGTQMQDKLLGYANACQVCQVPYIESFGVTSNLVGFSDAFYKVVHQFIFPEELIEFCR